MKTKIANGKFMGAFGLSLQLLDPDFYAMGNYAHQVIREVHKVEDRIFDFFTVHRERNRQWKEREKNLPPGSVTIVKKGKFARRGCV